MADYSKYADVNMPVTVDDHIMTIKFNRPDRRNAIGPGMHEALEEILTTVNYDEDVRVIVMTGEGDKAFCAGADVRGLRQPRHRGPARRGIPSAAPSGSSTTSSTSRCRWSRRSTATPSASVRPSP